MKKRKTLVSLLLVLSIALFVGSVWNFNGETSDVYAAKTREKYYNDIKNKKRLKKKIENVKKISNTLVGLRGRLTKWKNLINQQALKDKKLEAQKNAVNQYAVVKEKSLKFFQNEMAKNLIDDLNQNFENVYYNPRNICEVMKDFGWKQGLISLIFDEREEKPAIKFIKIGCCPEIMIRVTKKFDSKIRKYKFLKKLNEINSKEESVKRKMFINFENKNSMGLIEKYIDGEIFLVSDNYDECSNGNEEICHICITLMNMNDVNMK